MAPARLPPPEARTTATKGETVDTTTLVAPARTNKGRKARTNLGRFRSLERHYWRGALTAEEEGFEALCLATSRLYKQFTQEDLNSARVVGRGLPIKDD
jgi:hypothetical protein